MNGFIFLHRSILEWEWYQDHNTCRLFLHLLLKANWEQKQWRGIQIERGQLVTSLSELATDTGLTIKQIRRAIKNLEKSKNLASKGTNKYTIITICNFDTYQAEGQAEGQTKGQTKGKQRASKRATTEEYNKNNNIIKEEFINNPLPPKRGEAFKADFSFIDGLDDWKELLQIWLDYKKAKKQTYKSQKSIEALFAQLHKLSNGDIDTAKKIVEQSMANNWQGLFELKTQNTQNTRTNGARGFTHAEAAFIVEQSKKIRL